MKQKIVVGSVVQIDLSDKLCSFAQVLSETELVFFNYFEKVPVAPVIEEIVKMPSLFILHVMNSAVKSGRWPVIGKSELQPRFQTERYYFHQDILTKKISIAQRGDDLQPATSAQIKGLERLAVWDPEHVEDRLRDTKENRSNLWYESLKPV